MGATKIGLGRVLSPFGETLTGPEAASLVGSPQSQYSKVANKFQQRPINVKPRNLMVGYSKTKTA
jgi:hypothetical protein